MSQALKEYIDSLDTNDGYELDNMINDDQEGYLYAQALQILNDGNTSPLDSCHIQAIIEVNRKEFLYRN